MSDTNPNPDTLVSAVQVDTLGVKCSACDLTYSDFSAYKRHVMAKHAIPCKDNIKLVKQVKNTKQLEPVICYGCSQQFCSKYTLQNI